MKNGTLITAYLDYCEENLKRQRSKDVEDIRSLIDEGRIEEAGRLSQLCLDDGWTLDELYTAYGRRFNVDAATLASWRAVAGGRGTHDHRT